MCININYALLYNKILYAMQCIFWSIALDIFFKYITPRNSVKIRCVFKEIFLYIGKKLYYQDNKVQIESLLICTKILRDRKD